MSWKRASLLMAVIMAASLSQTAALPAGLQVIASPIGQTCRWVGTSPACQAGCDAGENEVRRDASGDGATCWTGYKLYCCRPVGAVVPTVQDAANAATAAGQTCRWVGTSPACQAGCEAGENEVARSPSGDGATCWTGYKTRCCKPIPVVVAAPRP